MYNARYLQPQVSTVGLIAHYKLWDGPTTTDKVFDYNLNGHTGTLKGTLPTFKYPGIDLPGTDEYIEIDDHADFTPVRSISAWIKPDDTTNFSIASKGVYNATNGEWWLRTGGTDEISFVYFDESVPNCYIGRQFNSSLTTYENQWVHVVGTNDGGTVSSGFRLYLNGVRVDDIDAELNPGSFVAVENLTAPVFIGRYDTAYVNGLIEEVIFFDKELSATEAKSIYEVTRQRYGV